MQISKLQNLLGGTSERIVAYINSTPILKQAAHAKKLEENPNWTLVLGLGYNDNQKKNTIYQHLHSMLDELRNVTGGDATKAKQLTDMLYTRVHAGESRRVNATQKEQEHEHAVNAGIIASIAEFVRALHDNGGDGRYPEKIRQAQQVICTAVSKAAVLSPTNTSIREISRKLGLSEKMISKCKVSSPFLSRQSPIFSWPVPAQERFDSLTDGEWEEIFDDHAKAQGNSEPSLGSIPPPPHSFCVSLHAGAIGQDA